jgi:hypothetical protein
VTSFDVVTPKAIIYTPSGWTLKKIRANGEQGGEHMKKFLVVFVAGLMVFLTALPAFAVDIKVNGDFRVRGFYHENVVDGYDKGATNAAVLANCAALGTTNCDDQVAYNSMRFLLTTTATAGLATGVVTLDFTSANNSGNLRLGGGGSAITGESDVAVGPADDRFALVEAYIKADLRVATLAAGRQTFKLGHGIIFEDSADGFVVDVPAGPAKLTLADLKLQDNTDASVVFIGNTGTEGTGADTDLYAANLSIKPTGDIASNLFFAYYNDRGTNFPAGANDLNVFIVGVTGDANLGPLTLGGEIDFLTGEVNIPPDTDLEGLNVQVSGGANVGPANVGLTFLYASGQDPASTTEININGLDGNYSTGFILTNSGARSLQPKDGTCITQDGSSLVGAPGCIAGSGLIAIKGTGNISPIDRLSLQADVIYAMSAEDSAANSNDDIGVELDGSARYKIDDNLSVMGGIGYLLTGDWWKPTTASPDPDNIILLVGEISYHF